MGIGSQLANAAAASGKVGNAVPPQRIAQLAAAASRAKDSTAGLGLPPIPEGYVRLTHVMPEHSRQILSSGEPFIYKKHGLFGTTDSYSDNSHIERLAQTGDPMQARADGSPSNFTRNPFGNHMAIMDLPADAHKRIALSYGAYDEPLPNASIVGFVDRDAMSFEPNPRYDRAVIDDYGQKALERIRQLRTVRERRPMFGVPPKTDELAPLPQPELSDAGTLDIW